MATMNLDNAPGWMPEVGDVLIGKVVDVSRAWSEHRETFYPIVTIEPESPVRVKREDSDDTELADVDAVAVHAFHTVLYNRFVELRPEVGERIGIKYVKATEKSKVKGQGNTPAIYNVRIDGRATDVWDTMEQDPRITEAKRRAAQATAAPVEQEDFDPPANQEDDDIPF